jgi:hypothetical protein
MTNVRWMLPPALVGRHPLAIDRRFGRTVLAGVLTLVVAGAVTAAPLAAQAPRANNTALSINPLGLPFEWFSAELERKTGRMVTVGASFSYFGLIDDVSYLSFDGKVRLYPNEEALRGFSIGISLGLVRVAEDYSSEPDRSEAAPSVGVVADYNWLLGRTKRFLVGTGVGAKRILGDGDDFNDASFTYPTLRFQVGAIF